MKSYKSHWPENLLLVGAGATVELGLYSTYEIGEIITELVDGKTTINKIFKMTEEDYIKELESFLLITDETQNANSQEQAADELGISHKRIRELQHVYDWNALKQIAHRCPRNDNVIQVQDLFNLIDMSIESNQIKECILAVVLSVLNLFLYQEIC